MVAVVVFFGDNPEMLNYAKEKVAQPLFSVVVRIATQAKTQQRTEYLAQELAHTVVSMSKSDSNVLIPLSNEGYEYNNHVLNVFYRKSNRWGVFMNSSELAQFVHYPDNTVHANKLGLSGGVQKEVPKVCIDNPYVIGTNQYQNTTQDVSFSDEMRLRHTHVIGATGVGKSTLLSHMMFEDIKNGNGCVLFDPHGDIVEDVMAQIPETRIDDVILIDPSDSDFPIGFNLLYATTEAEKIVLSSDLVSAFAQHATAWGDQMTSVLSNAINAFLESEKGGTLIELKRFLLEKPFRDSFLETVQDNSILYYWEYEFPMLKKGSLSPLLTRIDTFLRPKIIRSMLAQKTGVDFAKAMQEKKIILIKLSQGLIGEENSYLLASLFLAKLLQSAQGRQALPKEQRHPFYIYLDEFQNFITPSITQILSGARKYGLGLTLAHQELAQIDNAKVLGSVLSNPYIRICFRLGDVDSKKLESGFSTFEQKDLQSLGIGEAIVRVGKSTDDFNIQTFAPAKVESEKAEYLRSIIRNQTRSKYAKTKEEVNAILDSLLPQMKGKDVEARSQDTSVDVEAKEPIKEVSKNDEEIIQEALKEPKENLNFEQQKEAFLEKESKKSTEEKEHRRIQNNIKTCGEKANFLSSIEKEIAGKKRIDVLLERSDISIACEVSVSNTIDYEIQNIEKCLPYASIIIMTSPNKTHLANIEARAKKELAPNVLKRIKYLAPDEICTFISSIKFKNESKEKIIKGYRVKVEQSETDPFSLKRKMNEIYKVVNKDK